MTDSPDPVGLDHTHPAAASLLVVSGPAQGEPIDIPADGLQFGRAADATGTLGEDQTPSRWHARLKLTGDGLIVEDLSSTDRTVVNGQQISGRQAVRPGDVPNIGASQLQVVAPAIAPAQLGAATVQPESPGGTAPAGPQPRVGRQQSPESRPRTNFSEG